MGLTAADGIAIGWDLLHESLEWVVISGSDIFLFCSLTMKFESNNPELFLYLEDILW